MSKDENMQKKMCIAIGKILDENPGAQMKDIVQGFSDWFAFISMENPKLFAFFIESYLKWVIYYGLRDKGNEGEDE